MIMDRLTEKEKDGTYKIQTENLEYHSVSKNSTGDVTYRGEHIDKLAKYEDTEEHGLLLKLPCKVEDQVFYIVIGGRENIIKETKVVKIVIRNTIEIHCEHTVLTPGQVIPTYEEAKRRLQEIEEESKEFYV